MPAIELLKRMGVWRPHGVRVIGRGIMLAALVGVVAGLGAIVFHLMCLVVSHYTLEMIVGYHAGGPKNEMELAEITGRVVHPSTYEFSPWLLLVVPTLGGLVSGFLVYRFAPEAEGHGTDSAIDAYHNKRGYIRPVVPLIKMVTSAITLGTGGSGGREGPIAQIGAGFGSFLATRLRLSDNERRTLMAAGLGAGIGAIFHAPLAGAIFAIEVLYRDPDFEAEGLIPAFIATAVAYSVFSMAFGLNAFKPLFAVDPSLEFTKPWALLGPLAVLALTMALASLLYVKTFYGIHAAFQKMKMPRMLKPALGAMLTGLTAVIIYFALANAHAAARHDALSVLSFGYGFLQKVLDPGSSTFLTSSAIADGSGVGFAITLLLIVGLGKILTTALTIGSGGSGGVFGPSMVIGGSLGAVVGLAFHKIMPGVVGYDDVVVFAILGMASFFAAAANTPVSTLIMVSEMTDSYALLMPSMWVCALAYLVSRRWTLYREQVASRIDSPAHRGDFIIDIMRGLTVRQAMTDAHRRFLTVPLDMPLAELGRIMTTTLQSSFPVVDNEGRYHGLFSLNDIRQFLYDSEVGSLAVAQDLETVALEPLTLEMDLSDAITRFAEEPFDELPVVDKADPNRIVGMLKRQDLITLYDKRLLELRTAR